MSIYREATTAELKELKEIWDNLTDGFNRAACDEVYQDMIARYNEPHRAYHNTGHLVELFAQFKEHKDKLKDPVTVGLALFFHDVIYDVATQDSEAKSAAYAKTALKKMGSWWTTRRRVANLINMTADHKCKPSDTDAALMLDMDMAVLGSEAQDYKRYTEAVEKEYATTFSEDEFCQGRLEIYVRPWLAKDRFFITDEFEQRFADQTRDNLQNEKAALKARLGR